jgi:hypothetical protein
MNAETYEGSTFRSSMQGLRHEHLNLLVFWLSILTGMLAGDIVVKGEVDWPIPTAGTVSWVVTSWLMRGMTRRMVFRSEITTFPDYLGVAEGGKSDRVPLRAIKRICIDRSASGHRRRVTIGIRNGRRITLRDPEQGDAFESWAREVARPAGVDVQVNVFAIFTGELFWSYLLWATIGVVICIGAEYWFRYSILE